MIKMLRSVVTALQSMSEFAIACDNSDCGELITFYGNEARPIVCRRCGRDIKWERHRGAFPEVSIKYEWAKPHLTSVYKSTPLPIKFP